MTLIRILRRNELVTGDPGDQREVSTPVARALINEGAAVRVIVRDNTDIEKTVRRLK